MANIILFTTYEAIYAQTPSNLETKLSTILHNILSYSSNLPKRGP
jgi:hypothetical protein